MYLLAQHTIEALKFYFISQAELVPDGRALMDFAKHY